jgi:hypothetical protein
MARTFYTERDIQDLAKRGVTEIPVDDSVYITDAAREMMDRLGMTRKVTNRAGGGSGAAGNSPVRTASSGGALTPQEEEEVIAKVKSGVIARLGAGVDTAVVDQVVRRVVGQL